MGLPPKHPKGRADTTIFLCPSTPYLRKLYTPKELLQ